jgi:carbonic anhydrase
MIKDAEPENAVVARAVDSIEFHEWSDLEASVERDVAFLKGHPLIVSGTVVTGWIFHVETGKVGDLVSFFYNVLIWLDYKGGLRCSHLQSLSMDTKL